MGDGVAAKELGTEATPTPEASLLERYRLTDQVAVVTGGASGIGREVVLSLAAAGADVAILDVSPDAQRVAEEVVALGRGACACETDVTSAEALAAARKRVVDDLGSPSVLVACAGVSAVGSAVDITEGEWDAAVDVNLKGTFLTAQAFAPVMLDSGGSMVFIASNFGLVGFPHRAPYVAAKTGVIGLARALALEWAPSVRVNAICPCLVRTPMVAERLADDVYVREMIERIPLGRFAETADVAAAAIFLASSASSMVTGHALAVDGGWTAQ